MAAALALGLAALAVLAGCAGKQQIRMATGGNTGTYYAFGSAVGQIFQEKLGIPVTVQSTGASKANIQLIDSGDVELALVQNDVMAYAYQGIDLFAGEQIQSFAALAGIYAEACQVVVNPGAGIASVADLRGKRVSVGDAGSGVEFNARQIMEAYGLSFDDISKQNLSFGDSADALKDDKIDAFFCVAGAPTPAIVELATTKSIKILEFDNEHIAALKEKYPFYTVYPIPAGSYGGLDYDIKTVAVKATFIVSKKLPDETVYNLAKTLIESKDAIAIAHPKGKELSAAGAVESIPVDFHPGAKKYFTEIGALQ
jgi:TRAP transporter TAXI family solute receptor